MEESIKRVENFIRKYSDIISAIVSEGEGRVCLVGGTVRDFILGIDTCDLDFVVEGDAIKLGKEIFKKLNGRNLRYSEHFGTLSFELKSGLRIDLARARREIYPIPGKHPKVTFVDSIEEDLGRRDFTINSIAAEVVGDIKEKNFYVKIIDLFGGVEDILAKKIKVLHKDSISDDPTRMLRAVRLSVKLGFEISRETLESFEFAKQKGTFYNVEGDRFFSELKLGAADDSFFNFILELDRLSVLFSIKPELSLTSSAKSKLVYIKDFSTPEQRVAFFLSLYYDKNFPDKFQKIVDYFKVSKNILKLTYDFLR